MKPSTQADAQGEPALSAPQHDTVRLQDAIDQPARRLGAKRSALQLRKHRKANPAWHAGLTDTTSRRGVKLIASSDAALEFAIHPTDKGLLIEKRLWQPSGLRTAQTMHFRDAAEFDRWCALEPLRFEDPLLHGKLSRCGHECLANGAKAARQQ